MASELKVDKFTGVSTAGSILVTGEGNSTTTNLQQGLAKAWGNLDGTGTIAIRDSFNIGSATDGGTGYYTFNYTNDMSNDDYSASENVAETSGFEGHMNRYPAVDGVATNKITFGATFRGLGSNAANFDVDELYVTIFGDLA